MSIYNRKFTIYGKFDFIFREHNNIIKIFWMMYILFPFRIKGYELIQNFIYYGLSLVSVGILVLLYQKRKHDKWINRNLVSYICTLIILTFIACLLPFFYGTYDSSYAFYYFYYWGRIVILSGTFILCHSFYECIDLIIDATSLYVIFSIILLLPSAHSFYMGIVSNPTIDSPVADTLYSKTYYTRFGLQGFSGFGATFRCSVAVLLCCYMLSIAIKYKAKKHNYILRLVINIIGNCFYGRVGVIASLALILFTILYLTLKFKKFNILMIGLIITILIFIVFSINVDRLKQIESIYWMFEGFFNYLQDGKFVTSSSTRLQEMYIKPSLKTILLGDGYYTKNGHYYMKTDVGFLRPLFFGGIFMIITYYSLLIPLLNSFYRKIELKKFFICLSLILIFIFELKGEELLEFTNTLFILVGSLWLNSTTWCAHIRLGHQSYGSGSNG